jgi:long-chain-fatty-acid--CoA ligase ACSBG
VYTTNEASACQYVAEHSEARLVVLEDQKQLDKYLTFRDKLPNLAAIIMWADSVPSSANSAKNPVVSWDAFLGSGTSISEKDLQKRRDAIKPGHCATLIYTSGTTGNPKAVMMSHDNMIFESAAVYDHIFGSRSQAGALPDNFRILSYLPLSHVAAQMLDIVFPIYLTAGGIKGAPPIEPRHYYTVWFARPDALKGTLKNSLVACRPTMFLGVPRVWEKIRESMMEIGRSTTGLKKVIATWAKAKALEAAKERQLGGSGSRTVAYLLAKKIVLSKIRQALGLDECLICLSGAAPIPTLVMEYFASLDLDILEVYGMSESTGGTTLNTPAVHKIGSVGPPVGPIEVKIDHVAGRDNAGEGEICYRGRSIMMGYMKEPGKTKDAIDQQGWLHSGDVGTQDEHGMVRITGRLKELIIGAGGENIAPVPIEDKIKELCPAISNAMMVGDKRKYNTILFTVKTELNKEDNTSTGKLAGDAERLDPSLTTSDEVVEAVKDKSSVWAKYLQGGLDEYNKKFSVSNAQKIQKFTVLPGDFSEKGGELTATLKLKRSTTEKKYQKLVDAMY